MVAGATLPIRSKHEFRYRLVYLVAAVAGVVHAAWPLPPMLGYRRRRADRSNALALAQNSAGVRYLAEFGVVFLDVRHRSRVQPACCARCVAMSSASG